MKYEHLNEIKAIVILAIGMLIFASLVSFVPDDLSWYASHPNIPAKNLVRITGAYTAGFLFFVFGYSAYFLVVFLLFWSWNKFLSRTLRFSFSKFISFIVLFSSISALFSMTGAPIPTARFERAGLVGYIVSDFFIRYLGYTGSYIVLLALTALSMILLGEFLLSPVFFRLSDAAKAIAVVLYEHWQKKKKEWSKGKPTVPKAKTAVASVKSIFGKKAENLQEDEPAEALIDEPRPEPVKVKDFAAAENRPQTPVKPKITIDEGQKAEHVLHEPKAVGAYQIPSLNLLEDPPKPTKGKVQEDLVKGAQILEAALAGFGVQARVADIERGPVITRYELEPGPGVKVQRITTLADDIALTMRAPSVRIVAPIPGKNRVGVEVPNTAVSGVYLKDVLTQSEFSSAKSKIALALGKDISGKPIIADLGSMPHLLIAGTTGSGKTVCVHSIIMSMLFNAAPDEVKFIMVDPKMVELTVYNDLPHCLCPAITDVKKVSGALNWVVSEMESRYKVLAKAKCRNITTYHSQGNKMPYIVVVIDELADLMQVSAKAVEGSIARLAQLSRAVGIHLIIATQRPSVDVITGVIKANFPARISFKVASKVDSRTILDMNGAEDLVGRGDMLFMKPGDAKPTRGQCSFVKDEEIQSVIQSIVSQQQPEYDENVLRQQPSSAGGGSEEQDELYDEAVKLVIETNQASVSILQRRMRLGYTRAARLIDMMEQHGIVGPYCGSKPRDILVDREEWLTQNMSMEVEKEGNEPS